MPSLKKEARPSRSETVVLPSISRGGGQISSTLAPGTGVAGAQHLAVRVLEAFRRTSFGGPAHRIVVTVSIGVVSDSVPDESIAEDLQARADEALYAAKRTGRNCVVLWSHGLESLRLHSSEDRRAPASSVVS